MPYNTKEKQNAYRREYRKRRPDKISQESMYKKYILNAKNRGIKFSLSIEYFKDLLAGECAYCGDTVKLGIDRIDSNRGYVKYNTVTCCWMCNKMKNSYNIDDFVAKCKQIAKRASIY